MSHDFMMLPSRMQCLYTTQAELPESVSASSPKGLSRSWKSQSGKSRSIRSRVVVARICGNFGRCLFAMEDTPYGVLKGLSEIS
jgi:hypothetical protein